MGIAEEHGRSHSVVGWALLACAISLVLLAVRSTLFGTTSFLFLPWNLFLATVPLLFSTIAWRLSRAGKRKFALLFLLPWLLFFPNAPYILTDLLHLKARHPVPLWYDLFLLLSFALNGLFLGFLSLLQVERVLHRTFHRGVAVVVSFLFVLMAAYGIYLGRFRRLNSWDILSQPRGVAYDTLTPLLHPMEHPRTMAMTLILAAVLWTGYRMLRGVSKAEL